MRDGLSRWKDASAAMKRGDMMGAMRALQLKQTLEKIPNRALREGFNKIIPTTERVKHLLRSVCNNCNKKPRDALFRWRNFVVSVKQGSLIDAIRAHKLKLHMLNMSLRNLRVSFGKITQDKKIVQGQLKRLVCIYTKKPVAFFRKWAKTNDQDKAVEFAQGKIKKGEKMKNALAKPSKRAIRSARQRTQPPPQVPDKVRLLIKSMIKLPKDALQKWKDFVKDVKSGSLLDNLRGEKLQNLIAKIPNRTMKDAEQRIVGHGDKIAGILRNLDNKVKQVPRNALQNLKKHADDVNKGRILDNLRAHKLKNSMRRIPNRTMKDAQDRVLGQGDKVRGMLKNLDNHFKKIPRDALRNWKNFNEKAKTGDILDNLRAQKLEKKLAQIPLRTVKDAQQRILGQGDKVTGMLKNLDNRVKQIPRSALQNWKKYADDVKNGEVFDNLRAYKLKLAMTRIPNRTLRDAEERILGQGDKVTGMLKNLDNQIKKIPREALRLWKNFNEKAKTGDILDNLRAQKLEKKLAQIPLRTIKDAQQRIIGQGDKVTGMLKNLDNHIKKIPRDAIRQWRNFNEKAKTGDILDNLRAEKLVKKLSQIPLRTVKDAQQRIIGQGDKVIGKLKNLDNHIKKIPRDAIRQWRNFNEKAKTGDILDNLRAEKLEKKLSQIPLRTVKDAQQRIIGQGDKVTGKLKNLDNHIKKIPRDAIRQWRNFNEKAKTGDILDNLRAQKLEKKLSQIPLRTVKDAQQRIIGQGDKVTGMLKNLDNQIKKIPRDAIRQWKNFNEKAKTGDILDNLRAEKLEKKLSQIPLRTVKDAQQRIFGQGNKVTGMLKNLDNQIKKIPRDALRQWRNFNEKAKTGDILDNLRAQKLEKKLSQIPLRTVKDAQQRIIGQGDKVTGMLKNLDNQIKKIPRDAIRQWKNFNEKAKTGDILDNLRAQKLEKKLSQIPLRTVKDAQQRIFGQGNKVTGMLKNLDNQIKKIPRDALRQWKNFNEKAKTGDILDNLRAQKLEKKLSQIPLRTVKDAQQRIIGQGHKVTGMLKNLDNQIKKIPRDAIRQWRNFNEKAKTGDILDNLRAQKLEKKLSQIPLRTVKDAQQRIFGQGNKVTGMLKNLDNQIKKIPRDALRQWKNFNEKAKTGDILDNLRAQKLEKKLSQIPLRSIKDAQQRIIGQGNKVAGMLKNLDNRVKTIPRSALKNWRNYVDSVKNGEVLDNLRALKLKICMTRIPLRTLRETEEKILGKGDLVNTVLKRLDGQLKRLPREALRNWRKFNDDAKNGQILDNLRAKELQIKLDKIPLRTMKDAQQRLIGQGDKIGGMIKNLEQQLKRIPRQAMSQWKDFNQRAKAGAILDNLRAKDLESKLRKIPIRTVKDATQRIVGQGDKVKGMIKNLEQQFKKIPRQAMNQWKKFN